jgi:hypothetical protein
VKRALRRSAKESIAKLIPIVGIVMAINGFADMTKNRVGKLLVLFVWMAFIVIVGMTEIVVAHVEKNNGILSERFSTHGEF